MIDKLPKLLKLMSEVDTNSKSTQNSPNIVIEHTKSLFKIFNRATMPLAFNVRFSLLNKSLLNATK